ncbi:MAG: thioredoxin family protein [bacterium]
MRVEILGTGCARCQQLTENVRITLQRLGSDAEVHKVEDITQIMAYGVMSTPALVVDGLVKFSGRVPAPRELEAFLRPADLSARA